MCTPGPSGVVSIPAALAAARAKREASANLQSQPAINNGQGKNTYTSIGQFQNQVNPAPFAPVGADAAGAAKVMTKSPLTNSFMGTPAPAASTAKGYRVVG
jgi:hypothetical protein